MISDDEIVKVAREAVAHIYDLRGRHAGNPEALAHILSGGTDSERETMFAILGARAMAARLVRDDKKDLTLTIIDQVYAAIQKLGGMSDILSIIGSWGDTLSDEDVLDQLKDWLASSPVHVSIAYDEFSGDIVGHYVTREGKHGVVVQQDGTRVVHVYGKKWLKYTSIEDADKQFMPEQLQEFNIINDEQLVIPLAFSEE